MTIYIMLLVLVAALSMVTSNAKDQKARAKLIVIVSGIAIVLIQGLRADTVGIDLIGYLPAYKNSAYLDFFGGERLYNYELGYSLFTQVLARLGVPEQWFLTIVAALVIIPIGQIWIQDSKMPAMSVFIYITMDFFIFTFSGLRQSIALAIAFYSYRFIKERKLFFFALCVFVAAFFHTSAMFFALAYPLYTLKIQPKWYLAIVPVYLLIFLFRVPIFQVLYTLYKDKEATVESTGAYTMLLVMAFILFASYFFVSKDKESDNLNAYRNYLLVATGCQIFSSLYNTAMRVGYYYFLFVTLIIPEIIAAQKEGRIRLLADIAVVGVLTLFFLRMLSVGYLDVAPYRFFWE